MATYTFINEADAPAPTRKAANGVPNENQILAAAVLDSLESGKAAEVVFEDGDNRRAINRNISTLAKQRGVSIRKYVNGDVLYVRLQA